MKCKKKYFPSTVDCTKANMEFDNFSSKRGESRESDSIHYHNEMDPKSYGASAPLL